MQKPILQMVLRGYDPIQVDALLYSVWPALDGTIVERDEAKRKLSRSDLSLVLRGYDPRQVDTLITDLGQALDRPPVRHESADGRDVVAADGGAALGGLNATTTPQVARSGEKVGDYVLIVIGGGMLGWILHWGHWANVDSDVIAVMMAWVVGLGMYRLVTRLTWSTEEVCLITGPWRRRISLRDLAEVSYRRTHGMPDFVLRDTAGHKLVISGMTARQQDWKPFILEAARTAAARLTPGTEFLLSHPNHSG